MQKTHCRKRQWGRCDTSLNFRFLEANCKGVQVQHSVGFAVMSQWARTYQGMLHLPIGGRFRKPEPPPNAYSTLSFFFFLTAYAGNASASTRAVAILSCLHSGQMLLSAVEFHPGPWALLVCHPVCDRGSHPWR